MRALLPWARAGGDRLTRDYCHRLGIEVDPPALEALAVAYWLDRAAYRLRTFGERRHDRGWRAANVEAVIRALPLRL